MLEKKFDQNSMKASMEDFEQALEGVKQRIIENANKKHFDVINHIGSELDQFLQNVSNRLLSSEMFLVLFKMRLETGNLPVVPQAHNEEGKNHEVGEEPSVTLNEENTEEDHNFESQDPGSEEEKEEMSLITHQELRQLAEGTRGVMNKGKTLIGKEVLDFDMSQKWTQKLVKIIEDKYILPKSIKRVNLYSLDADSMEQSQLLSLPLLNNCIDHCLLGLGINLEAAETVSEFKIDLDVSASAHGCHTKVTEYIDLQYFSITAPALQNLMRNFSHVTQQISLFG